jgi:dCTP deaminase
MLRSDRWIMEHGLRGGIRPFCGKLVRQVDDDRRVTSFGLSSYGYDLRLSPVEFLVMRRQPGAVVDPLAFDPSGLEPAELQRDANGAEFFILPGHSYGLGVALEWLSIPDDHTCLFIGKSTYARCGIIANLTPGEAGWHGHLTLEISNASASDCRIYANQGIVQALFFQGDPCGTTYAQRGGKYQGQQHGVTLAAA